MLILIWFIGFICTCALHRYMVLDKWFTEDTNFYVMNLILWFILILFLMWARLFTAKPVKPLPFILS